MINDCFKRQNPTNKPTISMASGSFNKCDRIGSW